jgi:two-component system sensor histidine kinase PilS (NtrC family)
MLPAEAFCVAFLEELAGSENFPDGVVTLEVRNDFPVCFDRSHLHQVLWNLVSNAVRHSTGEPGAVRVVLQNGALPGRVELHVIDDGQGIPESVREQIFEPFFTTHTQGTGLGLFIARELCATNGASLELVASSQGAHFIVAGRNDTCQPSNPNDAPVAQ